MIAKAIRLSKQPMTLAGWLAAVTGVVLVRTLLENLSSPGRLLSLDVAMGTLIHYWLFYVGLGLALVLLISRFSQLPWEQGIRLLPYGLLITWMAPILDLLVAGGSQPMAYVWADQWGGLLTAVLTFFGGPAAAGITLGIRLELLAVILFSLLFIRRLRQDWRPALSGALLVYLTLLLWLSLPSVVYLLAGWGLAELPGATPYWRLLSGSSLSAYSLNDPLVNLAPDPGLAVFFNALLGRLHWLLVVALGTLWYARTYRPQFRAVWHNSRWERLAHWCLLLGLGLAFASLELNRWPASWYDWLAVIVTGGAFFMAWLFAVSTNDIVDAKLDAVANPQRPIPSGRITVRHLAGVSGALLLAAVLGGYLAGPAVLFGLMAFTAAYWIYSMPPLRLKRWPLMNPFLVSLACLSAVAAGFFLAAPGRPLADLPASLAWLIVLGFTLAANVKDVKDIAGDRQEGIATIPVILGERRGVGLVAVLVALSFWLVPLILGLPFLALTAVPAGLAGWWLVRRRPYREIWVFGLYFLFALASLGIWMLG